MTTTKEHIRDRDPNLLSQHPVTNTTSTASTGIGVASIDTTAPPPLSVPSPLLSSLIDPFPDVSIPRLPSLFLPSPPLLFLLILPLQHGCQPLLEFFFSLALTPPRAINSQPTPNQPLRIIHRRNIKRPPQASHQHDTKRRHIQRCEVQSLNRVDSSAWRDDGWLV